MIGADTTGLQLCARIQRQGSSCVPLFKPVLLSIPSYIHYNWFGLLFGQSLHCFWLTRKCDECWHEQWERNLSYFLIKEKWESCVFKCFARFKSPQLISLASVVTIKCLLDPILKVYLNLFQYFLHCSVLLTWIITHTSLLPLHELTIVIVLETRWRNLEKLSHATSDSLLKVDRLSMYFGHRQLEQQ